MRGLKSLRVYDASVEYAAAIGRFLAIARVSANVAEQLRSASLSIGRNIAEGHGRGEGKDRRRIYRIARGEAQESLHDLRGLVNDGLMPKKTFYRLFNHGRVIVKMLDEQIGD